MKRKTKCLIIILSSLVTVFIASIVISAKTEDRRTISDAEYAKAWVQVQNTMSKHAYYHAVNDHKTEVEDIWVKRDGPYFKTASWGSPRFKTEVGEDFYDFYVTINLENKKKSLEALSKIYPDIENVPENLGVGYWLIHTQTTPIIEIAGDGKTAKGIWYSPGFGFGTHAKDDEVEIGGYWYWEKYAVDFVNEDGEWKIWHLQTYYDLMPKYGSDWTKPETQPSKSDDAYKPWSPTTVPRIEPKFPEPYYTFSETFSY